ncbi:MAG: hypothetical protein WBV61_09190 [Rhodanobacteraceae bacterium]
MPRLFADIFGRSKRDRRLRRASDRDGDASQSWARFRPRLVDELSGENLAACAEMRAVLDACRAHDEEAQIVNLRKFAVAFRRIGLAKSVFFYPYLRWALENDQVATTQFKSMHAEVDRHALCIEAILSEYLGGPWDRDQRRRFVSEVVRIANFFSKALRVEESLLYPLYLPPGQYRYVGANASAPEESD